MCQQGLYSPQPLILCLERGNLACLLLQRTYLLAAVANACLSSAVQQHYPHVKCTVRVLLSVNLFTQGEGRRTQVVCLQRLSQAGGSKLPCCAG